MDKLSAGFLDELFKSCLRSKDLLQVCTAHIKYEFLPTEEYKEIWKFIVSTYELNGSLSSYGTIQQAFQANPNVISILAKIKNAELPEKESLITQLEEFVKRSLVKNRIGSTEQDNHKGLQALWNSGNYEGVYKLINQLAQDLNSFSMKKDYYEKIFDGYENRFQNRKLNKALNQTSNIKVPFGIPQIDFLTGGGVNETDTFLFLAQSGVGKTKLLRWIGVQAARLGFRVLHIQAEGSEEECLRGYDSTWTGLTNYDIDYSNINQSTAEKLKKVIQDIKTGGGEIYVHAFEQFDSASLLDVKKVALEVEKNHGKIDLILLDYLELFDPANGVKYKPADERFRREAIGNGIKNLAVVLKTRIGSCTQASSVSPDLLNDPKFKMTRYNVSECKGIAKPFSYFFTINQTEDEKEEEMMRIYCDKFRFHKSGQIVNIYTAYKHDRFINLKKTATHFWQPPTEQLDDEAA
jgi:replicative DNA helicase